MRIDIEPAASALAELVRSVDDAELDRPTPCAGWSVRALLEHLAGVPLAFAGAARKEPVAPDGEPLPLAPGWRERLAADLAAMVEAWAAPEAWTGTTRVGGVDLPGEVCGLVGLDELVVHGWDLSRATRRPWSVDDGTLRGLEGFLAGFEVPADAGDGPFAPPVPVPDGLALLDRVVALAGRRPDWGS